MRRSGKRNSTAVKTSVEHQTLQEILQEKEKGFEIERAKMKTLADSTEALPPLSSLTTYRPSSPTKVNKELEMSAVTKDLNSVINAHIETLTNLQDEIDFRESLPEDTKQAFDKRDSQVNCTAEISHAKKQIKMIQY